MTAYGFHSAEEGHVVNILAPVDIDGGKDSDIFSMKNHSHVSIVIQLGVTGGTSVITVEECDDVTPSNSTAIAFSVWKEETAGGDTLGAKVDATSSGFTSSANDGVFYVIEIDANQLADGFPYLRVRFATPGSATFGSAVAVLSGSRYARESSETAIT